MRGIDSFIDALYGYNIHNRIIDKLCRGELRFSRWAESLKKKRMYFESATLELCAKNGADAAKALCVYNDRFSQSISRYSQSHRFDIQYNLKENRRGFLAQKYHECRLKEITNAKEHLDKLQHTYGVLYYTPRCTDYYDTKLSDEKLEKLYNYFVENGYLSSRNTLSEFTYYFTGRGNTPTTKLYWQKYNTYLSRFLNIVVKNDDKMWSKAEKMIFANCKGLLKSLTNHVSDNAQKGYDAYEQDIKSLIQ